jgi:TP901 family phage tail tape measure protein
VDIGTIEAALKLRDEASATIARFNKNLGSMATTGRDVGESLSRIGIAVTAGVVVPFGVVIKSAKDFESAFANVVKTVEGFDVDAFGKLTDDAAAFREEILNLSTTIPVAADQLANVAAIGGQFGVAREDLLDFTETVAKLGVAVDGIEAETAAAALAQIDNVVDRSKDNFTEFANVLVDLGNKGNSTEGEILEFAKRLAGAGAQAGLSGDAIFGLGAAMANVGLNAEAGGTAMSRLLSQMSRAGAQGAEASQKFADFAGRIDASVGSGERFAALFQKDAKKALELFFNGLSDAAAKGENLNVILTELGVNEVRQRDTMLRLAGASGELGKQFTNAANAAKDGTALNEEARKKFATFDNQLKLFLNSVRLVAIEIGTPLIRALNSALQTLKPFTDGMVALARGFADLPPAAHQVVLALGVGGGIAGVLLLVGGQAVKAATDIKDLITTLNILSGVQVASTATSAASGIAAAGAAAATSARSTIVLTDAWRNGLTTAAATGAATQTAAVGYGTMAARATVAAGAIGALSAASAAGKLWVANLTAEWGTFGEVIRGIDNPVGALIDHFNLLASAIDDVKRAREGLGGLSPTAFVPLEPKMFSDQAPKIELPSMDDLKSALAGTQEVQRGIDALKAAVAALTQEQRNTIDEWARYGKTAEEIAKTMRLTEEVVRAYQTTSSAATKTQKELAKETAVTSEAFAQFAKEGVAGVEKQLQQLGALDLAGKFDDLTASSNKLNDAMREVQDSIDIRRATQGLSKEFVALVTSTKAFSREVDAMRREVKDADPEIQRLTEELIALKRTDFAEAFEQAVVETEEFHTVLLMLNPAMAEQVRLAKESATAQETAKEKTTDWTSSLKDIASAMANLKDLGGGLGFAAQFIAQADIALQSFGKVREGIKEFAKGAQADLVKAFSDMAVGITSGLAGVIGATDPSKDLGDRLLGGALQGASLGASAASMGAIIAGATAKGAATAGVWGAAAGVIVGIMIAVFRGRKTRREMEIVGEEWGTSISKGLYEKIKKSQEDLFSGDRVAASLFNFSNILQEAGGLNDLNFDAFTAKLRDVFVMIETGQFTTEQALHVMAENFDAFAQHVIESGEFASQGFLDILNLNIASGLDSPEIQQFILGRAGAVGQGLAAMLGPVIEGAAQVGDRVRKAFAAVDDMIKGGKQGTEDYQDAVSELNEALRHQREVAGGAIGDLENIGVVALATFARARQSGLSFIEALNAIGPSLDALIQAQRDLGLEGTNSAINQLMHYRELTNQFPALVAAASALGPTLVALQQMGGLTVESLAAMEDQGMRTFNRLIDAGFTENEALAQMADFLKQVEKAHKLLGVPIDENTQRMIDAARTAGMMGDEAVDATTQQRRGFELVTKAINQLIVTLGGVPIAIDDISAALDDIPKDINVRVNVELPDRPTWTEEYPGGPPMPPPGGDPTAGYNAATTPYGPGGIFDPQVVGAATAAAMASSTTQPEIYIEVPVEMDGEVVTRVVARRLPEYTELYGGPSSRTTV